MRATYSASTCGMHHMSLRHGLRSFSAKRRRTVSRDRLVVLGELDHLAGQQLQRPTGAALRAGLEQAVATSRASSLPVSLRSRAGARLFAERRLQVAEHEAALGPVDGRAADADAARDLLVAGAGVGRQQNLRPLELARRMLAAAQKRREFGRARFGSVRPDSVHSSVPPRVEARTNN